MGPPPALSGIKDQFIPETWNIILVIATGLLLRVTECYYPTISPSKTSAIFGSSTLPLKMITPAELVDGHATVEGWIEKVKKSHLSIQTFYTI